MNTVMRPRDGVILLHGIGMASWTMAVAERAMREAGYQTLNLDYPGRRLGLEALAAHVDASSARWIAGLDGDIHFLTHSMGGLVTRVLLATRRPARLGRVVMLGPPNGGSELADLLARYALYQRIFGPAGAELITKRPPALTTLLGEIDYPVGVIAGRRAIDPLSWMLLPKPNDGKVAVAHTRVSGMADHLILPVDHTFMVRDSAVLRAAVRFLRTGRFAA